MLPSPLYAICDADACARAGWTLEAYAAACLAGGARLLQVRGKAMPGRRLLEVCRWIVDQARPTGAVVIVNDRADVARIAAAAGVHVGQEDLAASAVRRLLGAEALVGLSTHTAAQVEAALQEPVSYLAVGPVFPTGSKASAHEPVGLRGVAQTAARAAARGLPTVAIGGVTLAQAPAVIRAGADAVAVIADLLVGGDPTARVRAYLDALGA